MLRTIGGERHTPANFVWPIIVLLAGTGLTGWLFVSLDRGRVSYDEARLEKVITSVQSRITSRFATYEEVLWGASGFLATSGRIRPEDWHVYVSRVHLFERYPGTVSMFVVQPVAEQQLESFIAERRREGNFAIHRSAAGSSAEHLVVVCAEPPAIGKRAVGADLAGDPRREAAAERARDTGVAALSQGTELGDGSKGLQLFIPVYREGAPLATVEDRRHALVAWVSVVFAADPFFRSALGELQSMMDLRVYDDEANRTGQMFFHALPEGQAPPAERTSRLEVGGRTWALVWTRLANFPYLSRTPSAWVAACTALLSLLLSSVVLLLQATRRRAADRLKLIQSVLTLGTWELDLHTGTLYCSPQLLRLYGSGESRERLSVAEWLAYIHPEDRDAMREEIEAPRATRELIDRQYRVIWKDGSLHWIHSKAMAIVNDQRRPILILGVDFEITEIKRLQGRLAQAYKLESVGQLAAGIAHEINTPIQYIGDNAKFLEDAFRDLTAIVERYAKAGADGHDQLQGGMLEYLRVEVPRAIEQLQEGVDHVAHIVRAMKEFSHPGPVEKMPVDINRAIESTILVAKSEWKYVADVTTDLDRGLPPVPCVAGEVNQVLLNLIVNAAHAISDVTKDTGAKGSIHISTRQDGSCVEIRVRDTGCGIPEAIQSKVFDPFFTTKPVGKGTGQGLAIAHSVIVQKHNGAIQLESEPGVGTTFVIQLPLELQREAA